MSVHIHVCAVLCCFALFICLTLLASFFLPSHLSFKNMYMYMYMHVYIHVCNVYAIQGWLLDMINLFGSYGGFQILHDRIIEGENLTVPLTAALIRSESGRGSVCQAETALVTYRQPCSLQCRLLYIHIDM